MVATRRGRLLQRLVGRRFVSKRREAYTRGLRSAPAVGLSEHQSATSFKRGSPQRSVRRTIG